MLQKNSPDERPGSESQGRERRSAEIAAFQVGGRHAIHLKIQCREQNRLAHAENPCRHDPTRQATDGKEDVSNEARSQKRESEIVTNGTQRTSGACRLFLEGSSSSGAPLPAPQRSAKGGEPDDRRVRYDPGNTPAYIRAWPRPRRSWRGPGIAYRLWRLGGVGRASASIQSRIVGPLKAEVKQSRHGRIVADDRSLPKHATREFDADLPDVFVAARYRTMFVPFRFHVPGADPRRSDRRSRVCRVRPSTPVPG